MAMGLTSIRETGDWVSRQLHYDFPRSVVSSLAASTNWAKLGFKNELELESFHSPRRLFSQK